MKSSDAAIGGVRALVGLWTAVLVGSLGAAASGQELLFDFGDAWRFFRGRASPSEPDLAAWRQVGFDDAAWETGATGIGYADNDDATILGDMQNGYTTVYLRRTFDLGSAAGVTRLTLGVDFDDGFVCYVNGIEAARANASAAGVDLAFDAVAGGNHEAGAVEFFELPFAALDLVDGENTIAIQVLNTDIGSSDLSFNARLAANDALADCARALTCQARQGSIELAWTPPPGIVYDSIAITRDGAPIAGSPFAGTAVAAVDASPGDYFNRYELVARLGAFTCPALVCLSTPTVAIVGAGDTWSFFRGTGAPSAPPTAWREVGFDDASWESGPTGIGYADGDDATELLDMQNGYLAVFARKTFSLADTGFIDNLVLELDYDDGCIAYLNGVEVARTPSMGQPGQDFEFDDPATAGREAGAPESYSVDPALLVAGANVLAVQVHNATIDSSDLSFIPRLLANSCPAISGFACAVDATSGQVTLSWDAGDWDSVAVTRNGAPLPGSPLAGSATQAVDAAPGNRDNVYVVQPASGLFPCATATCTVTCGQRDPDALTCELALVDSVTQARLSWAAFAGAASIAIEREGVAIATLGGGEVAYTDPNVESEMPEDDTDYEVIASFADGSACTLACGASLCVADLSCRIVDLGDGPVVELSWENVVKEWASLTITRASGGGAATLIADLDGDIVGFIDDTAILDPWTSHAYTLTAVAPAGEEVACADLTCVVVVPRPEIGRYPAPAGGWDYALDFESLAALQYNPTPGQPGNLDGRWIRDAAIDFWDGSAPLEVGPAPDGPAPGGIGLETVAQGGPCGETVKVLRVLQPGNTSAPGGVLAQTFPDPFASPNNRRLLLGLDTGVADRNLLRDGITLALRWRLTPGSPAYLAAQPTGDGSPIAAGLGQLGVVFVDDGSFGQAGQPASLSVSLQSGDQMQLSTEPVSTLDAADIDAFRTLWLTVQDAEGDGTYDVTTYVNGEATPFESFGTLAGAGLQAAAPSFGAAVGNFLTLGMPVDGNDGDLEIDFLAYKLGVHEPGENLCDPSTNNPPTARITASPGTTVTLAGGSATVTLDGAGSDDGDGGAQGLTYSWTKLGGPGGDAIESPTAVRTRVTFSAAGVYTYRLRVDDRQSARNADTETIAITVQSGGGGGRSFIRGDSNADGNVNIADASYLLNFLFLGGPDPKCAAAVDGNGDGNGNIADASFVLNFLFQGGRDIPPPNACGQEPMGDDANCASYPPCGG